MILPERRVETGFERHEDGTLRYVWRLWHRSRERGDIDWAEHVSAPVRDGEAGAEAAARSLAFHADHRDRRKGEWRHYGVDAGDDEASEAVLRYMDDSEYRRVFLFGVHPWSAGQLLEAYQCPITPAIAETGRRNAAQQVFAHHLPPTGPVIIREEEFLARDRDGLRRYVRRRFESGDEYNGVFTDYVSVPLRHGERGIDAAARSQAFRSRGHRGETAGGSFGSGGWEDGAPGDFFQQATSFVDGSEISRMRVSRLEPGGDGG